MVQIDVEFVMHKGQANEKLRTFQRENPKRKIINVSMTPANYPGGWFMTVVYEVDI